MGILQFLQKMKTEYEDLQRRIQEEKDEKEGWEKGKQVKIFYGVKDTKGTPVRIYKGKLYLTEDSRGLTMRGYDE